MNVAYNLGLSLFSIGTYIAFGGTALLYAILFTSIAFYELAYNKERRK
jgi:hypothetical protein